MKNKKKKLLIFGAIAIFVLWAASFLSPEWTIRRHILEHLQPINSLKADITNMDRTDAQYGHLYSVTGGIKYRATGGEMGAYYLKKIGIFWYVASAGSGP